jgi:hypothetical protein
MKKAVKAAQTSFLAIPTLLIHARITLRDTAGQPSRNICEINDRRIARSYI